LYFTQCLFDKGGRTIRQRAPAGAYLSNFEGIFHETDLASPSRHSASRPNGTIPPWRLLRHGDTQII
jgi:hypothetical protein